MPISKVGVFCADGFKGKWGRCAEAEAEAIRQSMLALIGNGKPYEAHPAFWAPFVVVGEGGAARRSISAAGKQERTGFGRGR